MSRPHPVQVIAVSGGKGGVGKSTTSVNLALALAKDGAKVGLLDADIYGPSQGIMLGIEEGTRPETIDNKWFVPVEAHGIKSMSMAYLVTESTPMVWRGPKTKLSSKRTKTTSKRPRASFWAFFCSSPTMLFLLSALLRA